ncbi:hypothetical protein Tco_1036631 [Tanacetum coccineum]
MSSQTRGRLFFSDPCDGCGVRQYDRGIEWERRRGVLRFKGAHYTREAQYHLCCVRGRIYMPPMPDPPAFIQQLLINTHFMKHIRAYNHMFAMTSFRAKIDNSVNKGKGPYVFKISSQILPLDWLHLLRGRNRMQHFGKLNEDGLNPEIVEGLIHVLDEHNGLVRLFRTAQDKYNAGERPGFKIRLCSMGGVRGYELPKSDIIGGIVFEDRPRIQTDFDVIIEFRGEPPQRINKLHQSYMSLQFFIICNRVESSGFHRKKQNDLRSDYLSSLYDAISRGDREGIAFGSKIMLPNTFTGGPRADIVCRVFEQTVKDFIKFLKDVRTFRHVYAGQLQDMERIEEFNSAEIPDPVEDPEPTYRAACEDLGLLGNDKEWDTTLEESTALASSKDIRTLFAQIPIYCDVADPNKLWLKHWEAMSHDIPTKISEVTGIPNYFVNIPELQGYILYELETILNGFRKSVIEFGLQLPPKHLLKDLKNKLLMEENNYKRDLLKEEAAQSVPKLNSEQKRYMISS